MIRIPLGFLLLLAMIGPAPARAEEPVVVSGKAAVELFEAFAGPLLEPGFGKVPASGQYRGASFYDLRMRGLKWEAARQSFTLEQPRGELTREQSRTVLRILAEDG